MVTINDIKENAKFKSKNNIIFIVDKIEINNVFGALVHSSLEDGKKGNYRDTIQDFVSFLNEENAVKL